MNTVCTWDMSFVYIRLFSRLTALHEFCTWYNCISSHQLIEILKILEFTAKFTLTQHTAIGSSPRKPYRSVAISMKKDKKL